jgi:hypothetical protein
MLLPEDELEEITALVGELTFQARKDSSSIMVD